MQKFACEETAALHRARFFSDISYGLVSPGHPPADCRRRAIMTCFSQLVKGRDRMNFKKYLDNMVVGWHRHSLVGFSDRFLEYGRGLFWQTGFARQIAGLAVGSCQSYV